LLTTKKENCTECWAENARKCIELDENIEGSAGKTKVLVTNVIVQSSCQIGLTQTNAMKI